MAEAATTTTTDNSAGLIASMSALKQLAAILGLAFSVALGGWLAMWAYEDDYRMVKAHDAKQKAAVVDYLEQKKLKYKLDSTGSILVREADFQSVQLDLSSLGVVDESNPARQFLEKDSGFGVSQRLEKARLLRLREQELSQTISQIQGVKSAKVHLALPKERVFLGNQASASASVMVALYPGRQLDEENVQSIVDLVAASTANLSSKHVTVIDQFGRLLNSGTGASTTRATTREFNLIAKREAGYQKRVESILQQIIGEGRYTVEVNVDLDFTQQEATEQTYSPNARVQQEHTSEDAEGGNLAAIGGVPGALSNTPPAASQIPEQLQNNPNNQAADAGEEVGENGQLIRREASRQYAYDTRISHQKQATAEVRRITASIGLDYKVAPIQVPEGAEATEAAENNEQKTEKVPYTDAEIEQITRLIQAAIGFDPARGDQVTVVNFPFREATEIPTVDLPELPIWQQPAIMKYAKMGLGFLAVLILIFSVIRPFMKKMLAKPPPPVVKTVVATPDQTNAAPGLPAAQSAANIAAAAEQQAKLEQAAIEKSEAELKQVRDLVDEDPTLVAQVVQNWVEENAEE